MSVYDAVIFFNELDLLEMRFEILNKDIDYFVVTESSSTFSGNIKPLYFKENRERFKKFENKIIYNLCDTYNPLHNQWEREVSQRNDAMKVLNNYCSKIDIVFCSDTDEIPDFKKLNLAERYRGDTLFVCKQDFYYYYLNTIFEEVGKPSNFWKGTTFSSWDLLKPHSIDAFRNENSYFNKNESNKVEHIDNAGWHFSFLGGADKIKYKIESYSHQEMNVPEVKNNIQKNIDELNDPFFRPNFKIRKVEMSDTSHPEYVMNNLEKYTEFIK